MTIKKNPSNEEKLLTDVELELMTILWRLGEGSVADVLKELPPGRELAYTSVSTVVRILEQKGVVRARKEGRGHIYAPLWAKKDYEAKAVRHVVDRVFQGTPTELVRQLVHSGDLTMSDLMELKALIAEAEKNK